MYKTLHALLQENIEWIVEYEGFYYVKLTKERVDDTVWKVDKRTEEASYMQYPMFLIMVGDDGTRINPEILKGAF